MLLFRCPQCIKQFATARGRDTHVGIKHEFDPNIDVAQLRAEEENRAINNHGPLHTHKRLRFTSPEPLSDDFRHPSDFEFDPINQYAPFKHREEMLKCHWMLSNNVSHRATDRLAKIEGERGVTRSVVSLRVQEIRNLYPELDCGAYITKSFGKRAPASSTAQLKK